MIQKICKCMRTGIRVLINEEFEEYIEQYKKPNTIYFMEKGNAYTGRIVYYIGLKDLGGCEKSMGFCALLNCVLHRLAYANRLGMVPIVQYPNTVLYYEYEMDYITTNMWEYYFEPVSDLIDEKAMHAKNFVISKEVHSQFIMKNKPGYLIDDEGIKELASVWKKYIRLNEKTLKKINSDIKDLKMSKNILGVHIRGTDFNNANKNHPVAIPLDEYIKKLKEVYERGNYTHIFVATDEWKTIEVLKDTFGEECLLYFPDVLRSMDGKPVHKEQNERRLHKYLLGYEIIRDVYALAQCDALIAGKSQVSITARIMNYGGGIKKYEEIHIIDNGMHK